MVLGGGDRRPPEEALALVGSTGLALALDLEALAWPAALACALVFLADFGRAAGCGDEADAMQCIAGETR